MKTVLSVYTLLINDIYLSHSIHVAGGKFQETHSRYAHSVDSAEFNNYPRLITRIDFYVSELP